jgi:hypothetical protein
MVHSPADDDIPTYDDARRSLAKTGRRLSPVFNMRLRKSGRCLSQNMLGYAKDANG